MARGRCRPRPDRRAPHDPRLEPWKHRRARPEMGTATLRMRLRYLQAGRRHSDPHQRPPRFAPATQPAAPEQSPHFASAAVDRNAGCRSRRDTVVLGQLHTFRHRLPHVPVPHGRGQVRETVREHAHHCEKAAGPQRRIVVTAIATDRRANGSGLLSSIVRVRLICSFMALPFPASSFLVPETIHPALIRVLSRLDIRWARHGASPAWLGAA